MKTIISILAIAAITTGCSGTQQLTSQQQVFGQQQVAETPMANCHTHSANALTKSTNHCHKNVEGTHTYKNDIPKIIIKGDVKSSALSQQVFTQQAL